MKITKLFIVLCFASAFVFNVQAQSNAADDKSDNSVFVVKEKLKKLKLLVSTEKDVKKVFGKECRRRGRSCFYKDDWQIVFEYVQKHWYSYEPAGGKTVFFKAHTDEYSDKLLSVSVVNFNFNTSFSESFIAAENLKCVKNVTYLTTAVKRNTKICSDSQGLFYFIDDEKLLDGKLRENYLENIYFSLPPEKYNEIIVLDKQ